MSLLRLRAPVLRPLGARTLASTAPTASTYRSPYDLESMFEPAPSSPSSPSRAASRSTPSSSSKPSAEAKNPFAGIVDDVTPNARKSNDPDAWWRSMDVGQYGKPGNQFTGRSMPVTSSFNAAFRGIQSILRNSGIVKEWRRVEWYEKPSAQRVRLNSERQRRRFQENIRKRVQLVEQLRSRK